MIDSLPISARSVHLLANSALLAGGACLVGLPLAVVLALLLTRTDLPARRAIAAVFAGLLFVPLYLQTGAWLSGFGPQGAWTIASEQPPWLDGWRAAIWIHGVAAVPWAMLAVAAGLKLVEGELEEEALLDGSGPQVLFAVTLRRAAPLVIVAALWIVVTAAGEMTVTDMVQVRTYAEELYTDIALGAAPEESVYSVLPGIGWTLAFALAALGAGTRLVPVAVQPRHRPGVTFGLGRWRWPAVALVLALVVLLVGTPLASLAWKAGVEVFDGPGGRVRSWSPQKCLAVVLESPWRYRGEFGWSLAISSLAATAATVVALPLAWWARQGAARIGLMLAGSAALLALPGPVIGIEIIRLLNAPSMPTLNWLYDHSLLAPCLAQTLRGLPWALLVAWSAFRSVPQQLLDSVAVEGAGPLTLLARVALPMRWSAIAAAWLISLAIGLGDLAASILVVPPGITTLSIRIFGLLHYGVEDEVAGICLALLAIFAFLAAVAMRLDRKTLLAECSPIGEAPG
jgi:iron(III) transport system permease protein